MNFFLEAAQKIALGQEDKFIAILKDFAGFSLYDLKDLLSKLPPSWKVMRSVTPALTDLVRKIVTKNCLTISTRRYHVVLPLEVINESIGMKALQVVDIAVTAIAEMPDQLGTGSLFNLIGLLALKLSPTDAKVALDYAVICICLSVALQQMQCSR